MLDEVFSGERLTTVVLDALPSEKYSIVKKAPRFHFVKLTTWAAQIYPENSIGSFTVCCVISNIQFANEAVLISAFATGQEM